MPEIQGSAEFSACGQHRDRLDRWWSDRPRALVCMTNPSDAGAVKNDMTVLRLIDLFSAMPDVGGFTAVNWETRIATDPQDLRAWRMKKLHQDEAGHQRLVNANLALIRRLSEEDGVALRIVAWGDLVPMGERQTTLILRTLSCARRHDLYAFGRTAAGGPTHPAARGKSRLVRGAPLIVWRAAGDIQ